jgi:ribonuclease HI
MGSSILKNCILHIDGAARGNPGPAGAGVLMTDKEGNTIASITKYLGEQTNNFAEYQALDLGLQEALNSGFEAIHVFADSELLVRQIEGLYKVKSPNLQPIYQEAIKKIQRFKKFQIKHVPREKNKEADKLANKAIDEG